AFEDDGKGDGRLTPRGVSVLDFLGEDPDATERANKKRKSLVVLLAFNIPYVKIFWENAATRSENVAEWDRIMSNWTFESSVPMWKWPGLPGGDDGPRSEQATEWKTRFVVLGLLLPDLGRAAFCHQMELQRRD